MLPSEEKKLRNPQNRDFTPSTTKKANKIRWQAERLSTHRKSQNEQEKLFKRNHPLNPQYFKFLQHQRNQQIINSEYSEAERKDNLIKELKSDLKRSRVRSLSLQHLEEKKSIKKAHQREMRSFRKAWKQIFQRNKYEYGRKLNEFQRKKQCQIELTRMQVLRRCRSARPSLKLKEIRDLEREEKSLRKEGRYVELKKIRSQKKKKRREYQNESQVIYRRIVEQEQSRLSQKQTKRYNSFMSRVEEDKKDKILHYKREEVRLKQKYYNIMRNLEHEQKMEINQLLAKSTI